MADSGSKSLKVVVVTPEKAVLDEPAEMVTLPLYDGEFGIMANHAPFVAQLGPGELRIKHGTDTHRLFIDGGFVQVANNVVNVLTQFARKRDDLTDAVISAEKAKADAMPATNDVEKASKAKLTTRVAVMTRLAKKI